MGRSLTGTRKRVSRACDECRLHKARCDGSTPCETCQRCDRKCSYVLRPSDCKGPGARIRILESRLVKANEHITRLQMQGSENTDTNMLSPSSAESDVVSPSVPRTVQPIDPHAGDSFLVSLLRPLSHYDTDIKALAESHNTHSLLHHAKVGRNTSSVSFRQLPAYDTALEHIYLAFNNTFGLCSIIVEQSFRVSTQRLYDLDLVLCTRDDMAFMPLCHAVLALGMINHSQTHQQTGRESALRESLPYFEAAASTITNNDESATMLQLQIRICLVFYHLGTSNLNFARSMLQIVRASPIVLKLLRSVTVHENEELQVSESRAKDIIWTICYIDMHISSLSRLPTLLESPGPEIATIYAINSAAYNVANHRRSSSTFLLSVSLAMAIELMKLIGHICPTKTALTSQCQLPLAFSGEANTTISDQHAWENSRMELQTWAYMLGRVFPDNDGNMQISLVGNELRLHCCLAEIMLYHDFLQCLSEPTTASDGMYNIEDINKGRACVASATNAITYSSLRRIQIPTASLTWSSAYVVFISALTLMVAAAFAPARERHTIHDTVYIAIQILHDATCDNSESRGSYLGFIRTLSEKLMIPFDFAPIREYTSGSLAEHSATTGSTLTDQTASCCDDASQYTPSMAGPYLWPSRTEEESPNEWGFDSG